MVIDEGVLFRTNEDAFVKTNCRILFTKVAMRLNSALCCWCGFRIPRSDPVI